MMDTRCPEVMMTRDSGLLLKFERHADGFTRVLLYSLLALYACAVLAFGGVEYWAVFSLQAAVALLFMGWLAYQLVGRDISVTVPQVFYPLAGLGIFAIVQAFTGISSYRYETLLSLAVAIVPVVAGFLAAQFIVGEEESRGTARFIAWFGSLYAVFALVQDFTSGGDRLYWVRLPRYGGYLFGSYVNHNHYAGLMVMLTPVVLAQAISRRSHPAWRIVWGLGALLMALSVFLSGSRGGLFSLLIELALMATLLILSRRERSQWISFALMLVLLAGFATWFGSDRVFKRASTLMGVTPAAEAELTQSLRITLYRDTLKMVAARPVLGWGFGNYPQIYPQFRSFNSDRVVRQAHNDYLQVLAETGVIGFALIAWFLVAFYRMTFASRELLDNRHIVRFGAIIGVTGLLIHSLVDFNLQIPANAGWFMILVAVAVQRKIPAIGKTLPSRSAVPTGETSAR